MTYPRFILVGGHVISERDGDRRYIGPRRLMDLYRLNPKDCVCCVDEDDVRRYLMGLGKPTQGIMLYPQPKGDYEALRAKLFPEQGHDAADTEAVGIIGDMTNTRRKWSHR